jgi:hypothetical protein
MKTKNTTSIYMTAAFLALGAKLENIDKTDPKHMVFCLSDGNASSTQIALASTTNIAGYDLVDAAISEHNLDVWEKAWANETLQVNAVRFMEAIQRLKSVIHSS